MGPGRTGSGKQKLKFTSSWDDGRLFDLKLAVLLEKFKLPGTFYIPSEVAELDQAQILGLSKTFEIGGHTMTHPPDLKQLDDKWLMYEIVENKANLESIIGRPITKFCYPRGRYDERVIKAVKNAGYLEARTTKVLHFESHDPFQTPTTIHVFSRQEYGPMSWWDIAKTMVQQAVNKDKVFHIWGHSWEMDTNDEWENLHNFFLWLTDNFDITK